MIKKERGMLFLLIQQNHVRFDAHKFDKRSVSGTQIII